MRSLQVNYFTLLDDYVMTCLFFLCTATAVHSMLPYTARAMHSDTADQFVDKIAFRVLCTFWIGFNVFAVTLAYRKYMECLQTKGFARGRTKSTVEYSGNANALLAA